MSNNREYLEYLAYGGGALDELPEPTSVNGELLKQICINTAGGGGGGTGSVVVVEPKTTEGVNIADIIVNGSRKKLYAPEGGSGGTANLEKYVLIDDVKYSTGYYIDAQGAVVSNASAGEYEKKVWTTTVSDAVPVVGGARYRFTFASKAASHLAKHGAWLDASNNVISLVVSSNGTINKQIVQAPSNAAKLILSAWIGGRSYVEKVEAISESELNTITYETEKQALLTAIREHQEHDLLISTPTFAPFKKGYVTLVNDDMRGQADTMYQICHANSVPLSVAAIIHENGFTNLNDTGRSYQEVFEDIVADGGEILAHHSDAMTQAMIEDYDSCYDHFATVKERMQKCGFEVNGCILSGGTGQVVGSPITDMWVRHFYQYSDLYGIPSYGYPYYHYRTPLSQKTLAQAKQMVDEAVQNKTWVVFYTHNWDDFSQADFTALVEYIASYDDDLLGKVTYKDVYDEHILYKTKVPRVLSVEVSNPIYNDGITISNATLHYSDGSTEDVTSLVSLSYTKVNIAVAGWYPVAVSYAGLTCTAPCRVVGSERSVIAENTFGSGGIGKYTVWSDGLLQIKNNATYKTGIGSAESVNDIPWHAYMGSITSFDPDTTGTNGFAFNSMPPYMMSGSNITHFENRIGKTSNYAFKDCQNLKSIQMIGNYALSSQHDTTVFENCPNFDTVAFSVYGNQNSRYQYSMDCLPTSIRNLYVGGNSAPEANWLASVPNRSYITDIYVSWSQSDPQNANIGSNNWGCGTQATVHYGVEFDPNNI